MIRLLEIATVIGLAAFVGVVIWAWRKDRASAFAEAANLPFALPEDLPGARSAAAAQRLDASIDGVRK